MSATAGDETGALKEYVGKQVVVDTSTPIFYIGTLDSVDDLFLTLTGCDVHDISEGSSTKELYCIEAKKFGIKKNRTRVKVRKSLMVSISLLEDVIEY